MPVIVFQGEVYDEQVPRLERVIIVKSGSGQFPWEVFARKSGIRLAALETEAAALYFMNSVNYEVLLR